MRGHSRRNEATPQDISWEACKTARTAKAAPSEEYCEEHTARHSLKRLNPQPRFEESRDGPETYRIIIKNTSQVANTPEKAALFIKTSLTTFPTAYLEDIDNAFKITNAIVAKRLSYLAEAHILLPKSHMDGSKY
ncbi:hypothetical protein CI238_12110 [Colletotrichum incanum]|uniref:Uncharacterized protein n=1 Tax=Colletotrichum incanum TaxID=1573173 RepID=A0A167ELU6_COLIC|nr:hypothetical protein CI238_12110 [Colletotrichum incanum]